MLRKFTRTIVALLAIAGGVTMAYAQPNFKSYDYDLSYFLPKSLTVEGKDVSLAGNYDSAIPTPKQVFGFELGERYCEWSDILGYVELVAAKSDRIKLIDLGRSHEMRRLVQLVITSPKNHANLEQIKASHMQLLDAKSSATLDTKQMPLVSSITCSMHGDEVSGANAAVAMTYFFAASQDEAVVKMLDDMVLLLTPGSNPDALNRYSAWANNSLGSIYCGDNESYEHNQAWPGARANHYYANVNRDLLMCQHPEGRLAVEAYLDWHPNLVLDLHEMGGKRARFFHSPGHPKRLHQYVTLENQALTGEVGDYVSKRLTPIGAEPYCRTGFDDYYLGKGAAYGDVQGSVCLLFEQSSARGYMRKYANGYITLPTTIRHQAEASIAALCAGCDMREKLLNYQRKFYVESAEKAQQSEVQGYIFHARGDKARAYRLLENLLVHNIDVYHLAKDAKVGKEKFVAEESYVIPLNQRYFYKVKAVWERLGNDIYEDLHFYDISTWTFPLAYNVAHAELKSVDGLLGEKASLSFPQGSVVGGKSERGYVIDAVALYSHNILNALLSKGVVVKVANKAFKLHKQMMACGSAVVEVANQPISADAIYEILAKATAENGANVYALDAKFNCEKLGLKVARMPKVALLVGEGIKGDVCGELWMLLEKHYGIAPARISTKSINKSILAKYNVLIAAHGALPKRHKAYPAIRQWVAEGGTIITTGMGYQMAARSGMTAIKRIAPPTDTSDKEQIAGAILNTTIDITSPVAYGYTASELPLFRKGPQVYDEAAMKGVLVPVRYTAKPHLSGYVSNNNIARLASTPAVMVVKHGEGELIHFGDNPIFRSYWFGGAKMLMNAVYFGYLY